MLNKRAVVKALKMAGVRFQETRRLVHLWCPFHPDRETPSLVIYTQKDPPSWYCFGCRAHGTWDLLTKSLKMSAKLDHRWADPRAVANLQEDIAACISREPCLPPRIRPWSLGKWRTLRDETLLSVHSQWWYDEIDQVRRIVWPVWDLRNHLVGWVGRDLDNKSAKKYRNMPRMNALNTLYPVPDDLLYPERTVVLVEGIPDALRLLQAGLPALANLGTSWSPARTNILRNLGIKRIILAFDGDEAGHRANEDIGKKLFALGPGVEREVWEWPEGEDPGSAPYSEIKQLRREILPRNAPHDIHPWLIAAPKPPIDWFFDHLNKEE